MYCQSCKVVDQLIADQHQEINDDRQLPDSGDEPRGRPSQE